MKLILDYLKKYIFFVLLIVGLTYVQVQTELALPDYMSDIVTNGIQYGGVTEEIPNVICADDMNELFFFMPSENINKILNNYLFIQEGTKAVVDNQEIEFNTYAYVLKEDHEDISEIMQLPIVYEYALAQSNLEVNKDNADVVAEQLLKQLDGLQDNYSSIVKIQIQTYYANVGMNIETIQTNYILHVGMIMLGVSLVSVVVQLLSTYMSTKIAAKIATQMRKDLFEKVESFSSSEFSKFTTSSLITRTGNDITKVQQLIQMMMRMMLMSPIMGITAVFKVIEYPSISWLLLVTIGIIISLMVVLIIFVVPKFEVIQKLTDKLNGAMREFLDGILVIRAFNTQKTEEEKFDKVNSELTGIDRFVSYLTNIASPALTIIMNLLTIFITWFSAKQIDIDVMTIGEMMAFSQYAMHVVISFMLVSVMFFMIPRSLVSAKRIQEVFDTLNTILDPENPEQLPNENGVLEFDNVSFKYPGADEYVLRNVSFTANPGETVAFIGSTGSGKSTVIKLIPRLFDVSDGCIKYCGKDIRNLKQADLRSRIGYATQKALLFKGTIKSNIEFGRDINDEELNNAITISQSTNILDEKENGVDELITQGGTNVSGGQKQRLSIARALAKNESIYIFDDSFSALDYETDKKLRKALNELISKTKSTVLIVAQRISTIKNADKIIVLENGEIVGIGSHEELLKNCSVYQQIASSQLSEEELNYARS